MRRVTAGDSPPRLGSAAVATRKSPKVLILGREWTTASAQPRATLGLLKGGVNNADHLRPSARALIRCIGMSSSAVRRKSERSYAKAADNGIPSARLLSLRAKNFRAAWSPPIIDCWSSIARSRDAPKSDLMAQLQGIRQPFAEVMLTKDAFLNSSVRRTTTVWSSRGRRG